jgi:Dolichyl-phosphate-mannose-protein mannosyltransferase
VPWIAAGGVFLVHLIANPHYGFFRDELYFIICGRHPAFGYVDQPPVIPLLSAATQAFGHSLLLLRAIPALCAAAGAYVVCLLAVEFGGGVFAQVLASLVFFFTGVLMNFGMKVSPDSIGLWTWPLIALIVARLSNGAHPRLWLLAGLVAGLSLESKYSVVFFLAALVAGLLLDPARRLLATWWTAGGAGVASAISLPNFLWQWQQGFPMLELLRNGQSGKNLVVGPLAYLGQEIIITGLILAAVWIVGLAWLFVAGRFRFLAYAYVVLIVEMMLFHGKHYYPADVYPILIAAGGVAIEAWTTKIRWPRFAVTAAVAVIGLAFLPTALPVLGESTYVSYETALGDLLHISRKSTATEGNRETSALPGDWADMHGWPELAATASAIYHGLPPAERARAVVFAGNYGEASAVAFFAPDVPVISEHNQYWLWGTRGFSGDPLIQIGGTCFHSDRLFASRTLAATFVDRWAIEYETDLPIWVCRGIKKPLAQVWPAIKSYE